MNEASPFRNRRIFRTANISSEPIARDRGDFHDCKAACKQSEDRNVWSAILGSRAVEGEYAIDLNRMYVGSSGSGSLTALYVLMFAGEFSGAAYIKGSVFWGDQIPDRVDELRRKFYVFITGSDDKAKSAVRRDYESYRKDGVQNARLIFDTKRIGDIPKAEHIEEALSFLDTHLAQ